MSDDTTRNPGGPAPPGADDIEILEVVAVSDDGTAEADQPVVEDDVDGIDGDDPVTEGLPPPPLAETDVVPRERLMRLQADLENLRKRFDRERDDHTRYATGGLVERLLPVLDNLERAVASARMTGTTGALVDGVAMVLRQFVEALRHEGLREIESLGRPFDPGVHEAVATDASPGIEPNVVVQELQRGYFLHDRVIRPAMVRVSVAPDPADATEEA